MEWSDARHNRTQPDLLYVGDQNARLYFLMPDGNFPPILSNERIIDETLCKLYIWHHHYLPPSAVAAKAPNSLRGGILFYASFNRDRADCLYRFYSHCEKMRRVRDPYTEVPDERTNNLPRDDKSAAQKAANF
jgi:hypothetical protein